MQPYMCVVLVLCLAMQFKSLQIFFDSVSDSLNLQLHFNSSAVGQKDQFGEFEVSFFAMWCVEHSSAVKINAPSPSPTVLLPTFCQF